MRHKTRIAVSPKVFVFAGSIFYDVTLTLSWPHQPLSPKNSVELLSFALLLGDWERAYEQRCGGQRKLGPLTVRAAIQQSPRTVVLGFTSGFPIGNFKTFEQTRVPMGIRRHDLPPSLSESTPLTKPTQLPAGTRESAIMEIPAAPLPVLHSPVPLLQEDPPSARLSLEPHLLVQACFLAPCQISMWTNGRRSPCTFPDSPAETDPEKSWVSPGALRSVAGFALWSQMMKV